MTEDALRSYTGQFAVLIDPAFEGRAGTGRGVFFVAAKDVTEDEINLMATRGRGICTVTINEAMAMRLGLKWQNEPPAEGDEPYFAQSVEAVACTETGISARERALTMRVLGAPGVAASDLVSPGHIMVQISRNIFRPTATLGETANVLIAAATACRFAGWCDILDEDGEIASAQGCRALADELGLTVFEAAQVRAFGAEKLKPWIDVVEFSDTRFK